MRGPEDGKGAAFVDLNKSLCWRIRRNNKN
jgi:hypothetical protein